MPEALEARRLLSATLVKDINTTPYSYPAGVLVEPVRVGDTAYFTSHQQGTGVELWKTDGTPAGTSIVKDILPGPFSSNPRSLTPVGNLLYFMADDGAHGTELWKTDGTAAGTTPVKDLTAGPEGSYAYRFGALGDVLIFTGPGAAGRDSQAIWRSDGTDAGTVMLKPVFDSSQFGSGGLRADHDVALFKGRLYFPAAGAAGDVELWATDGTEAGTVRVVDIYPGARSSNPGWLTVAGDRLFFMAATGNDFSSTSGPFVTDGTAAGTRFIRATSDSPKQALAFNGSYYWTTFGNELWRTDGTFDGTVRSSGTFSSDTTGMAVLSGALYFVANQRQELRRTDGSFTGGVLNSTLVKDFTGQPLEFLDGIRTLASLDGALFLAPAGEPWRSDGTAEGTVPLAEVRAGPDPSYPGYPAANGQGRGVFFAYDDEGLALWSTEAGPMGAAVPLTRIRANLGSSPTPVALGPGSSRVVLFNARVGNIPGPVELWRSDGTAAGTYRLKDFGAGILPVGNGRALLSVGSNPVTETWATDGTPEGTVKFPVPIRIDTIPVRPVVRGGRLYFAGARADGSDPGLWSTDGTPAGTAPVKVLPAPTAITAMGTDGTALYLATHSFQTGQGTLWKSDGTAAGTTQITTLLGQPHPEMTVIGGLLYFTQPNNSPFGGRDLWKSDGTAAGTARVAALPNLSGLASYLFTPFNGKLYYRGWDAAHGYEVWSTDGTPANTARVTDLSPEPGASDDINDLEVMDGRLYIGAESGLYRSDGTAAGTTRLPTYTGEPLAGIARQPISTNGLVRVGGRMYFTALPAFQRGGGEEVWRTSDDGSVLVPVGDVSPGSEGSSPASLTAAGDTLYFRASNRLILDELWMDRPAVPAVVGRNLFYNHSSFDGNSALPTAADDAAIATDKAALLPGEAASFANVTSFDKGINGVMIDVAGGLPLTALAGLAGNLDFKSGAGGDPAGWADAPRPTQFTIRPGAGINGSDRIVLVWADGAIRNAWLRVTVPALPQIGFAAPDVFYFGSLPGETGDGGGAGGWRVGAPDLARLKRDLNTFAGVTSATDVNRDGKVNALDLGVLKRSLNQALAPPSVPVPAAVQSAPPPALFSDGDGKSTRYLDELLA